MFVRCKKQQNGRTIAVQVVESKRLRDGRALAHRDRSALRAQEPWHGHGAQLRSRQAPLDHGHADAHAAVLEHGFAVGHDRADRAADAQVTGFVEKRLGIASHSGAIRGGGRLADVVRHRRR